MVGWFGVPSVPIALGSPTMLFATSVATAPADCTLRILTEKAQTPRETRAIFPTSEFAGSAAQASPSTPAAPVTTPKGAVRFVLTTAKSPTAAPYGVAAPSVVTTAPTKWGTELAPAVKARTADPGDSIVNSPGPELPAATATTMLA